MKGSAQMLKDNIRYFRKQKGFTQEELAIRLGVVRQTVSKWEKGLSVPDAEQLSRLAEIFETDTSELLGATPPKDQSREEITQQLARINEQLAVRNRRAGRIWKFVLAVIAGIIILGLILIVTAVISWVPYNYTTEVHSEIISELQIPLN